MSRFAASYRVVLACLFLGLAANFAPLCAGEILGTALRSSTSSGERGLHDLALNFSINFAAIRRFPTTSR